MPANKKPTEKQLAARFKKGDPRAGRPKGTKNKSTVAVKQALQEAFDGIGGVEALTKYGQRDPEKFYQLWVKMLPQEVKASVAFSPDLVLQIQKGRERAGD